MADMEEKPSFWDRFKKKKDDDSVEAKAKKEEEENKLPPASFPSLFRYTTTWEKVQMTFACLCAIGHGVTLPLFTIIFGDVITDFTGGNFQVFSLIKWFIIIGVAAAILAFFQIRFMLVPAHQTGVRMRKLYFESLLRQDAAFFDEHDSGALVTTITDIQHIQGGIGDKFTVVLQYSTMFVTGFIVAFAFSWKMTLVVLATTPLLGIAGAAMGKVTASSTGDGLGAYAKAGGIASEALSMIRTVTAFGAQKEEAERYDKELKNAYKADVKKAFATGLGLGTVMFIMLCIFGFALWYGNRLVLNEGMDSGAVFTVFFSVFIGASGLGQAGPSIKSLQVARGAAPRVFEQLEKKSDIDALNLDDGKIPESMVGKISFRNTDFNYKSRIDAVDAEGRNANVLEQLNLEILAGNSQALVGPSGCGKSTIARLVERFYDVTGGQILIDDEDVRNLNVHWLRSQIGYVGQMPTLFMMTIRENIALGARTEIVKDPQTGKATIVRANVTEAEIVAAAKLANADRFIRTLPEGYDTMLGERGAMLSGGQKQRICIARALVRNPKILILDESTASLDAQSERIVQEALDKASEGRTTLTIAHRLSTVKNADAISVLNTGKIVETGTHAELMQKEDGAYRRLVEIQNVSGGQMEAGNNDDLPPDAAATRARFSSMSMHKDMSLSKEMMDDKEDADAYLNKPVFRRTFAYNKAEAIYIFLGLVGAIMAGMAWPVTAVLMSKVIGALNQRNRENDVMWYSIGYAFVGLGAMVGNILQLGCLGISGERLTYKLRKASFGALLKQDMAFFDNTANSVGVLTTRLASEASLVKGTTGDTLGVVAVAMSTIGTGIVVAFYGCWRVALSVMVFIPGVALAGYYQMKMMTGFDTESEKAFAKSGSTASETVDNITAVSALGVQDHFLKSYSEQLDGPLALGRSKATMTSFAFGASEIFQFAIWAVAFWVGGIFVHRGDCGFEGMMMGVTGLIFGAASLGNISIFMPDVGASKLAAAKVFHLLDTTSAIDPTSETGSALTSVDGAVEAKSIKFEYPSRPDVAVLRGLSVAVKPGRTLALVGESGCGKSTIVSLLERFYDVRDGSVNLDDNDVKSINVQNLRSHMGIVSQEPDLFNRSVKDNICYGLAHADGIAVTDGMIEAAAKQANAHDFIMQLPQKYDTVVGVRGNQLSGGQKQRVAIARSIIRQPRVLLLDEATSALDAESERIAQDALDKAASERTTITIAHRLSTIKNADTIAVVRRGTIVEQGTHDELLAKGEYYAELIRNQLSS